MRILLTLAVCIFAVPDRPNPPPREDRTPQMLLLGDWDYVGNQPNLIYVFRILPTETVWIQNGQPQPGNGLTAQITLDWTKTPTAIDFMPRHGGSPLRGIIKVEGDRLTLAWSGGQTRPLDFSPANSVHVFTRIRR